MTESSAVKINREACEWVARFHGAEPSPQTLIAFREWMAQSPQHKAEMQRLAKFWGDLNVLTELAVPSKVESKAASSLWSHLSLFSNRKTLAGAFALSVLLLVALVLPYPSIDLKFPEVFSVDYSTTIGQQELVVLPDGSTVLLNTDSGIEIDYESDYRRARIISGEAHFTIVADPTKPFVVYGGNAVVRAVGTAFSVYLKDNDFEVIVTEGIVELSSVNKLPERGSVADEKPAILRTGQTAVFDQSGETVRSIETIASDEISRRLSWREGLVTFSGESLEDVVSEVSRYTTLTIVILDPELRDLGIGGFFRVGETEKMLQALESSFGVHVEYIDEDLVHLSAVSKDTAN